MNLIRGVQKVFQRSCRHVEHFASRTLSETTVCKADNDKNRQQGEHAYQRSSGMSNCHPRIFSWTSGSENRHSSGDTPPLSGTIVEASRETPDPRRTEPAIVHAASVRLP